ncbi:MAG TPA: CCA tRNA nucleotidyltransferase [Chloroflexus aurantiacus]|jgi:tRNA nucleotidyltransferase (CCA-adding enzyme)|uniref:Polynucleotide adenylyltransferase region n=1 Tax=Chloroflexus aurantiacus (strain ATCC 29366 / DSM 635 / J-10-fl) TaxID=324602 RepID=A9WEG8_CHLAA|nr:CCA tRNA nucleotidyltransferase [Chloroflexus aurantiacus]ABY35230.1 Polynucleotide adenylyltransferase region [Chloroflexus aurantiacus J-10-fl]RMG50337.1 MAG: CCA tRNA nucleotidyltransferase [Chloroflexota bacterium]GIV92368.1 MAG: polynucleotide adenylyltransferase [Chloroflexus sp.]HBW65866.1 CCA tRNA nucleotidyltransferase [Chloroflexus aurantiacus]
MKDLITRLDPKLQHLLARAAALAADVGATLWLVGGVVRDLWLELPIGRDIDLAVEGDINQLIVPLADAWDGTITARHPAFGTATITVGHWVIDLAQTRTERYPKPAILPEVQPAPLTKDLYRRDFSINAMAVQIIADGDQLLSAPLIDPLGGVADLTARRLRLLHDQSLRDDPTRLLRGVRLAARLQLTPDAATAAQIADALEAGYLALLSPERIQTELCLTLEEPDPAAVIALADQWGLTPHVIPGLHWTPALAERLSRYRQDTSEISRLAPDGLVIAGLVLYDLSDDALTQVLHRYHLPAPARNLIQDLIALRPHIATIAAATSPSAIDTLLQPYSIAAIAVLHYATETSIQQVVSRYLHEWRPLRPPLNGDDLRHLGVPTGPQIGQLLRRLRAATLDGLITDRTTAEQWVRRHLVDS